MRRFQSTATVVVFGILGGCAVDATRAVDPRPDVIGGAVSGPLRSDHGDLTDHPEADLTDLYAFTSGPNLVLLLCVNPRIPIGATSYAFSEEVALRIHIDRHSEVSFADAFDLQTYGGTILRPDHVAEDVTFEVTFAKDGVPQLRLEGLPGAAMKDVLFEAGLYDDPFISSNINSQRRNVAAIAVELPLSWVADATQPMLIWATSKLAEDHGPITDHVGRALWGRVTTVSVNHLRPRDHFEATGKPPDVIIFNPALPVLFPNGRLLEDDVRHIVDGDPPAINNVAFLSIFPYLAPPNLP